MSYAGGVEDGERPIVVTRSVPDTCEIHSRDPGARIFFADLGIDVEKGTETQFSFRRFTFMQKNSAQINSGRRIIR